MSTVAKKPPAAGRDPAATVTPTLSPGRAAARASTPTSSATGSAAGGVARTRSMRTGNPVSARAAAQQRRESPLSNGTSAPAASTDAGSLEREEAARGETIALLDDLKARLATAESSSEQYQRQAEVLQSRLDEALAEQAKMEERVHENEEQIEFLTNETREAARQKREMEAIYEGERSHMAKEKEDFTNREEEMQTVIQRLKDSLAQRNTDDDVRPSRQSNNNSPSVDGGNFAPPSSIQRSDSRNNSKLILQKDKLIESLRLEVAEAQIKLVESENQGGGRLHEVERLLMEARMANARLMEDNESYQLLLQERTLKGDFGTSDFSYMGNVSANQDALAALEGKTSPGGGGAASLADELSEAAEDESENYRRLEAELKSMKDQNKALTLYINRIIERLLQHQDFEHILDQSSDFKSPNVNKDLPPPPGAKGAAGASLLQRAKSIAVGATSTAKPKPRPMSFMPSAVPVQSAHNNPETAPSIPIGLTRSTSVRRGRPMSEQYTGGAASVVNAMYKGGIDGGPLSPTLRGSQTFFVTGTGSNNRASSTASGTAGGNIPMSSSGNFPGMKSETSSVSGDSSGEVTTPPSQSPLRQSPPRHAAGGEKATTFAGNKPRPLRLVQENAEVAKGGMENKRASWIPAAWSTWGAKKDEVPGDAIRE